MNASGGKMRRRRVAQSSVTCISAACVFFFRVFSYVNPPYTAHVLRIDGEEDPQDPCFNVGSRYPKRRSGDFWAALGCDGDLPLDPAV